MQESGDLLLKIIDDILDFSKVEFGQLDIEKTTSDLHHCIEMVTTLMRPKSFEKGLNLTVDIDPQVPRSFYTDRIRLQQILTNLLANAIKFTEHGSVNVFVGYVSGLDNNVEHAVEKK